jgi:hypothetical protein
MSAVREPFVTQSSVQLDMTQEFIVGAAVKVANKKSNSEIESLLNLLREVKDQEAAGKIVNDLVELNRFCSLFEEEYNTIVEDYNDAHDKIFGVNERPRFLVLNMSTGEVKNQITGRIFKNTEW